MALTATQQQQIVAYSNARAAEILTTGFIWKTTLGCIEDAVEGSDNWSDDELREAMALHVSTIKATGAI